MRRRFAAVAVLPLLVGCADAHAPVAPPDGAQLAPGATPLQLRANVFPSPDTVNSSASAIASDGAMVGMIALSRNAFGPSAAVTWNAAGALSYLADGVDMVPADISDAGVIIANRGGRGVVYPEVKSPLVLAIPKGATGSTAAAINTAGTIVGSIADASGQSAAVVWSDRQRVPTATRLPVTLGVTSSGASDINAAGDIVGWITGLKGGTHAYVWFADGTRRDLGVIANLDGLRINNRQVVLLHRTGRPYPVAELVYAPQNTVVATVAFPAGTVARGVNDAGRVVGVARSSIRYGTLFHDVPVTILTGSGAAADDLGILPGFAMPPGGAFDVNACGQVAGRLTRTANVVRRPVQWVPADGVCDDGSLLMLRAVN